MKVVCLNIEQQLIEIRKYVSFKNDKKIKSLLFEKGYYRISRYAKYLHKFSVTEDKPSIEQLIRLYELDKDLRLLFIKYIKDIEIKFRNSIAMYLVKTHPDNPSVYLEETIYTKSKGLFNSSYRKTAISQFPVFLKDIIEKERKIRSSSSKIPDVGSFRKGGKYYREKLPVWTFFEHVDFGTVINIYEYLNGEARKKILIESYGFSKPTKETAFIFDDWMHSIRGVRNKCAHYNRIIGQSGTIIKLYSIENDMLELESSTDLFSRIYSMCKIMDNKQLREFKEEFKRIVRKFEKTGQSAYETNVLPSKWDVQFDIFSSVACEEI
jgi:abortive infection bacteriophage resistance protein